MASLANQTISSTYDGLIKTSTDQPVGVSGVQLLEDGVGNSLALSVGRANQGVTITGTLTATSISGVLADGVTATTQSSGDNSTKVATTAYVDAQVTASDLDFAGGTGTGAVDLDSQTFTIAGTANEIETSASGQTITIGLPSSVTVGTLNATTLGGTLSTAAQPNITSVGTLSSLTVGGALNATISTAAQPNITSVGTLSSLAVSGNLTVDTNTLFVDAANNRVSIGTTSFVSGEALRVSGSISLPHNNPILLQDSAGNNRNALNLTTSDVLQIAAAGAGITAVTIGTSGTERMRIDSSGNVGIGTSSPSASRRLHIDGGSISTDTPTIRISSTDSSGTNKFGIEFFSNNGADVRGKILADNNGKLYIDDNGGGGVIIQGNGGTGNVGIGTSSPSNKLQVNHTAGYSLKLPYTSENLEMYLGTVSGGKIGLQAKVISSGTTYPLYLNPEGGNVVIHSGDLSFANGSGIDFSASAGGGATSSVLDDYEEGTFTPTAFGSTTAGTTTYTLQNGYYTKIGRQVNVTLLISYTSLTGTGRLSIGGLPFTIANLTQGYPVGTCYPSDLNWTQGTYLQSVGIIGQSFMHIVCLSDDAPFADQLCVNEAATIRITLTYYV